MNVGLLKSLVLPQIQLERSFEMVRLFVWKSNQWARKKILFWTSCCFDIYSYFNSDKTMFPFASVCLIRKSSVLTSESPHLPTACSMVRIKPAGASALTWNSSVQLNLCQKLLFLHQLTHNMTTDCLLNYKFNTWKFQAQNMGRTCCVQKLFWMSETISVHSMFSLPRFELGIFMYVLIF